MTKDEKRAKAQVDDMDKSYSLTFTKRQLTIIFNVILRDGAGPRQYGIPDALVIAPILDKLEPYVAVATNIPTDKQGLVLKEDHES